jgi:hypothetical protein
LNNSDDQAGALILTFRNVLSPYQDIAAGFFFYSWFTRFTPLTWLKTFGSG